MNVEFLIATMNRRDISFLYDMFPHTHPENIRAVIINQCDTIGELPHITVPHPDIRVFSVKEKGIAKSRNQALKHSKGDIMVIADDDAVYENAFIETIQDAHLKYVQEDVLTFQIMGLRKKYSHTSYRHNSITVLRISTLEITFKKKVLEKGVLFDERFGLGSIYPIGEENIWLRDVLKTGAQVRFIPKNIVQHPEGSTGTQYTRATEIARGAVFFRICGIRAIPISFWFALKKHRAFRKNHSFFTEVWYLWKGSMQFLFSSIHT